MILIALVFILALAVVIWSFNGLFRKTTKPAQYYIDNVNSLVVSPEEFYKTLNFLLMYGVITQEQYTEIQLKALPFTG
jgi:hypothetical protein